MKVQASGKRKSMKAKIYPAYFLLGAVILYFALYLVPGILGIYFSFTNWNAYSSKMHFVGFQNFVKIFSIGENYLFYIKNTLLFTAVTTAVKTVLGLVFALMLNTGIAAKSVHRSVLFSPVILSFLITGIVFRSILNPATGMLNTILRDIGLAPLAASWLVDPHIAFFSVMGVDVWKGAGYLMVIYLAGLQAIPSTYYDAAAIDGAGYFQRLWNVTLPLLMPSIVVVVVLNILYGLRVFDIIYVLTNGGPGNLTEVINTVVFEQFSQGAYALANSLSTLLFLVMAAIGFLLIRAMNRRIVQA